MTDEQRQASFDDLQAHAEAVVASTEPVYWRNRHGRLELLGSGLLMRHGSLYCLLSAAHVLTGGGERWLGGEHSRIDLPEVFYIGGEPDAPPRLKAIDLAFAPLPAQAVSVLGDARFLTMADIEPAAPTPGARYYALGYLCADRRLPFAEDEPLRAKWTALVAKAAPVERYREAGLSQNTHLILDINRENTEGREGTGTAPKLNGMSGGGIFGVGNQPGSDHLAAILTAYRGGENGYIIASRPETLIAGIAAYIAGELAPEDSEPTPP